MDRLLELLKSEPVRARAYSLAVLVLGYLVTSGRVSASDSALYLSVLAVVCGVETARSKVTPTRKAEAEKVSPH